MWCWTGFCLKAHTDLRETLRENDELRYEYSAVKRELCLKDYEQCYR